MVGVKDPRLAQLVIRPDASIGQAMRAIDAGTVAIALVVAHDGRLLGTVTDGDLRRAMLSGATLDDPVDAVTNRMPTTVPAGTDRTAVLDLMRARKLTQVPEVDRQGRLVCLHVVHEILGTDPKPNVGVILAGGKGTRLGDLTRDVPKPMLEVAGRPILERLVLHLIGSGITSIVLSIGYLGEQIREHFGDGSRFGCDISYIEDDPERPLGTGGPLRLLARDRPWRIEDPLLVMNGDLVSSFSVASLLRHHETERAKVTVALKEYSHEVPFGVAQLDGEPGRIIDLHEKPSWTAAVNAGIYVIDPDLLERVPAGREFPITDLVRMCLDQGLPVSGWHLEGEWHDIGRPKELATARGVA